MMRAIFSILGLVIVVLIVGLVAKKQLTAGVAPPTPAAAAAAKDAGMAVPAGTAKQQIEQFQNAVQGAMQQSRPMPDDK